MSSTIEQKNTVDNYFEFTLLASQRAKEIFYGSQRLVDVGDSSILSAIEELKNGLIDVDELRANTENTIRAMHQDDSDVTSLKMNTRASLFEALSSENNESAEELAQPSINNNDLIQDNIFGSHNISVED